jgi:uncharacterized tellurite resistance protein B-like protein
MTPLQILASSLAYMAGADKKIEMEEKAHLTAVFGKLVTHGEITDRGLAELVKSAFETANSMPIDAFLAEISMKLSPLQRFAIFINCMDMMLVDGTVVEAENTLLKKMQESFGIQREGMMAVREVLLLKNDTRMFLRPEHPRNAPDARFPVRYESAAKSE